jgi:hypothetical protein
LQAWGPGGFVKVQRNMQVNAGVPPTAVPPPPVGAPEIRAFSSTPQTYIGGCVWVSWEFGANVARAVLYKNGVVFGDNAQQFSNIAGFTGNPNGDCNTPAAGTIVYHLDAYNSAGAVVGRDAMTVITAAQPR